VRDLLLGFAVAPHLTSSSRPKRRDLSVAFAPFPRWSSRGVRDEGPLCRICLCSFSTPPRTPATASPSCERQSPDWHPLFFRRTRRNLSRPRREPCRKGSTNNMFSHRSAEGRREGRRPQRHSVGYSRFRPHFLRGHFSGFSLGRLMRFLALLGRDVEIAVKTAPRRRRQGRMRHIAAA